MRRRRCDGCRCRRWRCCCRRCCCRRSWRRSCHRTHHAYSLTHLHAHLPPNSSSACLSVCLPVSTCSCGRRMLLLLLLLLRWLLLLLRRRLRRLLRLPPANGTLSTNEHLRRCMTSICCSNIVVVNPGRVATGNPEWPASGFFSGERQLVRLNRLPVVAAALVVSPVALLRCVDEAAANSPVTSRLPLDSAQACTRRQKAHVFPQQSTLGNPHCTPFPALSRRPRAQCNAWVKAYLSQAGAEIAP